VIELYTEEQVEAYWCVRAMIQWGGLLAAIGSMVVLAVLVVKGKWPWLALVEGMVFVCAVVLAAGWVPKRLRPKIMPRRDG
jgi:mannose/fructose/N-acetylgalactosamine-specific phosphotransferase system component IIC